MRVVTNKKVRKPARVDVAFTTFVNRIAEMHDMDIPTGYTLYGTNTAKGRCLYNGNITIPTWLRNHSVGRTIWYVAHELAHAYTYNETESWNHTPRFMEWLKELCPEEHWHFELGYKPKNAKAAGITPKVDWNYHTGFARRD